MKEQKMPSVWMAKWITPEEKTEPEVRKPAGVLRKSFRVEKTEDAALYATAHGLYRLFLNGEEVSQDRFTPGCDQYDKRLQVQRYDVTPLLRPGENQVEVLLGDGWYRGCSGIDGVRNLYGEDLSFLCQLEVAGTPVLVTDAGWEASQSGPVRMTDLELGEEYDARREEITQWHEARELDFGFEHLVPTETVPVREQERFLGKPFTAPNGETVYDFGQNLAGYTELEVTAKGGEVIRLVHGETLDENGNFTIANFQPGERNKSGGIRQEIVYTCKPGLNRYKPSFSLFGFRYAKAESPFSPEELRLTAHAVYSEMKATADFHCANEDLDRLFQNSLWSMKSNFCDIPTDCPTRERAGWTGDAGVFAPTGLLLMDSAPVWRKWLANARLCQREDGKMAYIIPQNGPGGQIAEMFSASVGWGDACVLVPWALYQNTGDQSVLAENYDMMKRWVDFLARRTKERRPGAEETPYSDYIIDTGMDYGEWCEPGANVMETMQRAFQQGQPEVATAYFAYSAQLLSQIAALLGRGEDVAHYRALSEKAKEAYQWLWKNTVLGKSQRQCEYVRPLAFGLLDHETEKQAAAELDRLVRENDYHLNTGFLSTPYLCQVLAEHGYSDTAYRVLLQPECPGWLYAVKRGATTIWETWDGVREDGTVHDSLNHYAYGAVSGWLLSGVCGIRYRFDRLVLAPQANAALGWAEAIYDSPRGRIVSRWEVQKESGRFTYHFEIPEGVEAEILLPGRAPRR